MMDRPKSRAFVTYFALWNGWERRLKNALLFWDEAILETPTPSVVDVIVRRAAEEGGFSPSVERALRDSFIPVQERMPAYRFELLADRWEERLGSAWFEAALRAWREQLLSEHSDWVPGALEYEVNKLAIYSMNTLDTWSRLQGCVSQFLGSPGQDRAILQLGRAFTSGEPFVEMAAGAVPNVGDLPWAELFELREHPKLEAFRRKCIESIELLDAGIETDASKLLTDAFEFSLREVAKAVRPAPRTAAIKATLSNLPLPIPLNPLSIVTGVQEVAEQVERDREHGWIYFVLDVEDR